MAPHHAKPTSHAPAAAFMLFFQIFAGCASHHIDSPKAAASIALSIEPSHLDTVFISNSVAIHTGSHDISKRLWSTIAGRGGTSEVRLLTGIKEDDEEILRQADIVLHAKFQIPKHHDNAHPIITFTYDSPSKHWWASSIAWLGTWLGGHFIPDSRYRIDVQAACWLTDASNTTPGSLRSDWSISSFEVTTSFFDRNSPLSWPMVQSIFVPPILTSDTHKTTSDHLLSQCIESVADQICSKISKELEVISERDLGFGFRHSSRTTATAGGAIRTQLDFEVRTRMTIGNRTCSWTRRPSNGTGPTTEPSHIKLTGPTQENGLNTYRGTMELDDVDAGGSMVQIVFTDTLGDLPRTCSRTILLSPQSPD